MRYRRCVLGTLAILGACSSPSADEVGYVETVGWNRAEVLSEDRVRLFYVGPYRTPSCHKFDTEIETSPTQIRIRLTSERTSRFCTAEDSIGPVGVDVELPSPIDGRELVDASLPRR